MKAKTTRNEAIQTAALVGFLVGCVTFMVLSPALDRLDGRTCLTAQQIERLK